MSKRKGLRVYVAAKWEDRERAREVMNAFREAGDTITYDWTVDESSFSAKQAAADRQGVLDADIFVGVFEKELAYMGALVEMGMAAAHGIPIFIMGHGIDKCIFTLLPEVERISGYEQLCNKGQRRAKAV